MDEATRVSDQLRANGRVTRGRIGVQIDQVTKEVAESIGLGKPQGALIRGVEEGSPAEKAGIEAGDIIIRFDGKAIEKASDLPRQVGNTKPGSRVGVTVFRRGSNKDLSITVAEVPAERTTAQKATEERKSPTSAPLGLVVGELTDAQKRDMRLRGGVRIESVAEPASRAGLREGDVILAIANTEVLGVRDFEAVLARVDRSRPVSLLVRRGEVAQYVLIRPGR
jgi:serine protease Do